MSRHASRHALWIAALLLLLAPGCGDEEATNGGDATRDGTATRDGAGTRDGRDGAGSASASLEQRVQEALARGRRFLLEQQGEDGGIGDAQKGLPSNVGFTALAASAITAATPRDQVGDDDAIRSALGYVLEAQREDGAVDDGTGKVNYTTSAAINALAAAKIGDFSRAQAKAKDYLVASQYQDDESDLSHGAFPYKQEQGQPADLSNTQFAIEALRNAGVPADHPTMRRVRDYLKRVHNDSEVNPLDREIEHEGETIRVVAANDGGAFYHPLESKAGLVKRSDGAYEFQSYGSMTYAMLKTLLLAGVPADDPRVQRTVEWLERHWTVDRNPGMENLDEENSEMQGYYYYLMTAAHALRVYEDAKGEKVVVRDETGNAHDWRKEIAEKLLTLQNEDGSWQNTGHPRWYENIKTLATAYSMLALAHTQDRMP